MDKKVCLIPKNNASDTEVKISRINVIDLDYVNVGDLLFEFETSKAAIEVHSEFEGFVKVLINEGELYDVGFEAFRFFDSIQSIDSFDFNDCNLTVSSGNSSKNVFSKKALSLINKNNLVISDILDKYGNQEFISEKDILKILEQSQKKYQAGSIEFQENDIVIFGAGGHALQCLEIVEESDFNFRGYLANKYEEEFESLVLGSDLEDLKLMRSDGLRNIVIGFGQLENLEARYKLYSQLKEEGFVLPNLISKQATISRYLRLTENSGVQIFQGSVVGPKVQLMESVVLNSNSTVSHHCIIGAGSFIAPGAILAGSVVVGDFALIGMGATIYMDVSIDAHKIIPNGTNVFE